MSYPTSTFAYVADTPASTELYRKIFGMDPIQTSPMHAVFAFPNGTSFGLWARDNVQPAVEPASVAGSAEISFPVESAAEVNQLCDYWKELGLTIIQQPTKMDFGFTFTAVDPDGHRLRVHAGN